jgi:AraC-like DNA-binding protein
MAVVSTSVRLRAHPVDPRLGTAVRRIVGFAEHTGRPQLRRELPTPSVTVILGLGDLIELRSATGVGEFGSFLAGLHEIPVDTTHQGTLRCIQLDLSPLGAYRLLGIPMSELANTALGLDALGLPDLADRLAEQPDWPARFGLLEQVVGRRIQAGPAVDREVSWAWRRMARSHGAVPIGALAAEVGWSRRHLAARFRRQVGLTPKAAAQVFRFRRALGLLDGSRTIGTVAAETGYADHSHLVREFRRLTGSAPSALLDQVPEVTFVQDMVGDAL